MKTQQKLQKKLHNTDLGIWIGLLFGPRNSSFLLSCSSLFQNSTVPWKSVPLQISNINIKEGDFFSFQKKPFWELSFSSWPACSVASHVISVTCRRTCIKPQKVRCLLPGNSSMKVKTALKFLTVFRLQFDSAHFYLCSVRQQLEIIS